MVFSLTNAVSCVASLCCELKWPNYPSCRVGKECFLATRREVVCDRIFNHLHELDWATVRSHAQLFKQRHHQSTETVESSWNTRLEFLDCFICSAFSHRWVNFDQHVFDGFYVHLEQICSVQRRVHQVQQYLMSNVRPRCSQIAPVLLQYVSVRVCIQQFHLLSILH